MRAGLKALLLLGLCLCAGTAWAIDDMDGGPRDDWGDDDTWLLCSNSTLSGGWQPVDPSGLPPELLDAVNEDLWWKFGENLTLWTGEDGDGWSCEQPEELQVSAVGCSQVVAGANYKLHMNVTCGNWTLGLDVEAYVPPGANASEIQIYDLDLEFVAKNDVIITSDIDDVDGEDKWEWENGTLTDNPRWTEDDDPDHYDGDGRDQGDLDGDDGMDDGDSDDGRGPDLDNDGDK